MKKNKLFKTFLFILLYLLITKVLVDLAYIARGYKAIGAEYIVFPIFFFLLPKAIKWLKECFQYIKKGND